MSNTKKVLETICDLSCNWEGYSVFPIHTIANFSGLSKYATTKALHELREQGLVHNAAEGFPAVGSYTSDGIFELDHDAAPPLRGFELTRKGFHCPEYEKALKAWDNRIAGHFAKMFEEMEAKEDG